ncbi:MAG: DUF1861 family protein [Verrucomicrobiota bacterium]
MPTSEKILFTGVGEKDVYNITAPFQYRGTTTIAGRVESRDEELSTIVLFTEGDDGQWSPLPDAATFEGLQDPCITLIDGKLLLGGVRFPVTVGDDHHAWQMEFFLEDDQHQFQHVYTGPPKMKDIRFAQLEDGEILVLTRPQGERGGRGKIGFLITEDFQSLTDERVEEAPLFDQCPDHEWVGGNEIHPLTNTTVGVLGHIANFDDDVNRHYFAMSFVVDVTTGDHTPVRIIGKREDFPAGESKRPDLVDVIFSGGLVRDEAAGKAKLYAGLSDAEAGWVEIDDPFAL